MSREILDKLLEFFKNNPIPIINNTENLCKIWSIYNKNITILREEYYNGEHWSFRKDHPAELKKYYEIYEFIINNIKSTGLNNYIDIYTNLYKYEKGLYNLDELLLLK